MLRRIEATKAGLVAAWFGGTKEGASNVGIWFCAAHEGRLDEADRSRARQARRWQTVALLESGPLSNARGQEPEREPVAAAVALLQSRPEPQHLVGRTDPLDRWRSHLEQAGKTAGRDSRPDQEQAGAAQERPAPLWQQQRRRRLARAPGVHARRGPHLGEDRSPLRWHDPARNSAHDSQHQRRFTNSLPHAHARKDPASNIQGSRRDVVRSSNRWTS